MTLGKSYGVGALEAIRNESSSWFVVVYVRTIVREVLGSQSTAFASRSVFPAPATAITAVFIIRQTLRDRLTLLLRECIVELEVDRWRFYPPQAD